jgi:hypothetical protein
MPLLLHLPRTERECVVNRKIKFRAWDKTTNKMFIVAELFFNYSYSQGVFGIATYETTLKDRNGKEIYEGDVVQIYYPPELGSAKGLMVNPIQWVGVVAWENESKRWDYSGVGFNIASDEIIEVIGNIYENPELVRK